MGKANSILYHYTNISAICSIIDTGYLWLKPTVNMNDYLEAEFVKSANEEKSMFSISFSKTEENLAMYKMYASASDGVMVSFSYEIADQIIANAFDNASRKQQVSIVRNGIVTSELENADVYWTAICYKGLHTDELTVGTVTNDRIQQPMKHTDLAGFIKFNGWEYEKEIRLCAVTKRDLADKEFVAIKLPNAIEKMIYITLCPDFDTQANLEKIARLKRMGVTVHDSAYKDLVDMRSDEYTELSKEDMDSITRKMILYEDNDFGTTVIINPEESFRNSGLRKRKR